MNKEKKHYLNVMKKELYIGVILSLNKLRLRKGLQDDKLT